MMNIDDPTYNVEVENYLTELPESSVSGHVVDQVNWDMVLGNIKCSVTAKGMYIEYKDMHKALYGDVLVGHIDDDFHLLVCYLLINDDGEQMFCYKETLKTGMFKGDSLSGVIFDTSLPMLDTFEDWKLLE